MPRLGRAASTAALWALGFAAVFGLLRWLGASVEGGLLGPALAGAVAALVSEYRSTPGSLRRQQANRERHRASSPLWQPTDDDDQRRR